MRRSHPIPGHCDVGGRLEPRFTINEKRRWVVQVYPLGLPTEARPIATLPTWHAFERVESEAGALGETAR
jgi:hypothetical protein